MQNRDGDQYGSVSAVDTVSGSVVDSYLYIDATVRRATVFTDQAESADPFPFGARTENSVNCRPVRLCDLEIMEDAGSLSHVLEPLGIAPSGRRYVRYLDRYMAHGSQPRWATTVDPTPKHA